MKRSFQLFISVVSVFAFFACSNLTSPNEVTLSVKMNAPERKVTENETDETFFKLEVRATGCEPQIKYCSDAEEAEGLLFTFNDLKIGKKVLFEAFLYCKNENTGDWINYATASETQKITADSVIKLHLITASIPPQDPEPEPDPEPDPIDKPALRIVIPAGSSVQAGENLTLLLEKEVEGVKWSSSDTSIAIVKDGVVTALAGGTVSITAECEGYTESVVEISVKDFDGTISSFTELKTAISKGGAYLLTGDITISGSSPIYCTKDIKLYAKKEVTIQRDSSFTMAMFWPGATENTSVYAGDVDFEMKALGETGSIVIDGNNVDALNPAIIATCNSVVLSGVKFVNNQTKEKKGESSIFYPTTTTSANVPGALFISDVLNYNVYVTKAEIENCSFENNGANSSSLTGGAVCLQDCSKTEVLIKNCTFNSCFNALTYGGAIGVDNAKAFVENCIFSGNTAKNGGADVAATRGATVTVKNVTYGGSGTTYADSTSSFEEK